MTCISHFGLSAMWTNSTGASMSFARAPSLAYSEALLLRDSFVRHHAGASASIAGSNRNSSARWINPVFRPDRTSVGSRDNPAYESMMSPSGLHVIPSEGEDILSTASHVIRSEAHIPNGRVVINIQAWSRPVHVGDDVRGAFQSLAEESGISIGLKVNSDPYAYEFEPVLERARQIAQGELAAARAKKEPRKVRVEHSITLETMRKMRGLGILGSNQVVMNGLQNHLPSDSGGTGLYIRYLIEGRWRSLKNGRSLASKGRKVDAVAFSDDGRQGYDYRKLGIDYSDKSEGARGQFGRGLKQAAASALVEGMEMEILSRNWRAVAEWEPMTVDGKVVHKLCFDVEIEEGSRGIKGSRTIFRNPSQKFLDFLSQVERKVLYFRPNYRPVYSDGQGNAIVDDSGDVFVKGMHITSDFSERLLFGYDLNTEEIPSDRDQVRERVIGNLIGGIIAKTADKNLIEAYLGHVLQHEEDVHVHRGLLENEYVPLESTSTGRRWRASAHPKLWKKAFEEIFGKRAVLETDSSASMTARLSEYDIIRCRNRNLRYFLINHCHLPVDKNVGASLDAFLLADVRDSSGAKGLTFETSYTLSQRAKRWRSLRLILEPLSNHTPADSGGTHVEVRLKVPTDPRAQNYSWVGWSRGMRTEGMEEMQIIDDGRGYDHMSLRYSFSDKPSDDAIGQNGEGLQMASAIVLRAGDVKIKYRSRDWVATPFASEPKRMNRGKQQVVCFRVIEGVDPIKGSTTTIRGGDDDLKRIIVRLDDFVLPLRTDQDYIHTQDGVSMFMEPYLSLMTTGTVYNKGIFITDHYAGRLLFSYDLITDKISPDRDDVDVAVLEGSVGDTVSSLTDRKAIQRILEAASDGSGKEYMEFVDTTLDDEVAGVWREVFYEVFKGNAVVMTNPATALSAAHLGFDAIRMNEKVARTLHEAGVECDAEVINEGLVPEEVRYDDLTSQEREMIDGFERIDAVIGLSVFKDIKVFSAVRSRTGRELSHKIAGYWNGTSIYIARRNLQTWQQAARVYAHERGHRETGAGDPTDQFRNFFEYNLIALIGKELERAEGDPSYRVGVEGFARWNLEEVGRLEGENRELRAELEEQRRRATEAEAKLAKVRKKRRID